jgi:hypothetical protein
MGLQEYSSKLCRKMGQIRISKPPLLHGYPCDGAEEIICKWMVPIDAPFMLHFKINVLMEESQSFLSCGPL